MQRILFVLTLAVVFSAPKSFGQYGMGGSTDGLTATGIVEINVRPKWLQMTIQVEGRSSDLPQAAGELERRVEVAQKRLKELDVISGSVIVSKPKVLGASSPQQAEQMQMMMEQYGGGERGKQMLEQTASVSITQTITARWRLFGAGSIDRLISTKELTQKIRDADIASTADKQPVSPAQEELAVEMEAMMDEYSYGEEKTKTGDPTFRFVATIPANEYRKALTSAFAKAKRKIKTLADATGASLSTPLPLSSSIGTAGEEDYYGRGGGDEPAEDADTGDYEIIANDPIEAKCTVTVTAIGKH